MYDFYVEHVLEEIRSRGARRVLLQLPDGLRPYAFDLAETLRVNTGAEIILSGDSCYGACDLASRQAEELNVDLLVHYGHTPMIEMKIPVFYVETRIPFKVDELVEAALPRLKEWKRIGLATTVQHAYQLTEVADALRAAGKVTYIGKGDAKTPLPGQVLGCHYLPAISLEEEVDGFLFIGGGQFHPIGLALSAGKPVVVANPYNGTITLFGNSDLMQLAKQRVAAITYAKSANIIGVLVSSKPGQNALDLAHHLVEKLREKKFKAFPIYLDEVKESTLINFSEAEAFIDTACPRIALDGVPGFERPILTSLEAQVLLGEKSWEELWGRGYLA